MDNEIFKNIIKNTYNFDEEEQKCELCGEVAIKQNIYDANYCADCFNEAQESRM